MTLRRTLSGIAVMVATLLGACGSDRLLVGEGPDVGSTGAAGTGQPFSGAAGSGSSPSGAAGDTGAGAGGAGVGGNGVAGTGGAGTQAHLLEIPATDAIRRVAHAVWDSDLPDGALLLLAQQGSYTYTSDLDGLIRTMLADPRAVKGVGAFYRWWLDLASVKTIERDPNLFPEFTPALGADMESETERFGAEVTLNENGTYQTLLTAPYSWLNADLASIYGVAGVTGDTLQKMAVPSDVRAGLLTQPALQVLGAFAHRNSPSHRGTLVLQKFFCEPVPSAPTNVPGLDPIMAGVSVRQALAESTSQADCTACHNVIDPPGLAFEGFDAIGRARTMDNGQPIDTSALRFNSPWYAQPEVVLNGPVQVASFVGGASVAKNCFAKKWLAFVLGRDVVASDSASLASVQADFAATGYNLKELIVSVVTSDAFLAPPESQ